MHNSTSDPGISAGTIRPFANPYVAPRGYTCANNNIFDLIMPTLSGNALKILLVVLRQTWGYADPSSPTGRRQFDRISYSQFRQKSGIKSDATISRAVQECLDAGCLIRKRVGADSRSGKPLYAYALNTALEVSASEIKEPGTSDFKGLGTSEVEETKRKKEDNDSDDTPRKLSLLKDFTVNLDQEVRALAARYSLPQIEHGISRATQQAKRNPQGLLRCWMRSGDMPLPPPKEGKHATDSRYSQKLNPDAHAFAAYRAARGAARIRPAA